MEEELEQVFKKFDVNGDGKISAAELGSIMGSLGHSATEDELEKMIKEVDEDGDGFIDLSEFIELNTKDAVGYDEVLENLRDAFQVFDMDKNGSISAEELRIISFDEFKVMMMRGSRFHALGGPLSQRIDIPDCFF